MRRSVANFLAPKLCGDAISVVLTAVPANALELLWAGFVNGARYDQGRLLGEVGVWDLVAGGHHDILRRYIQAGGVRNAALGRALLGESIATAERESLEPSDRALVLLADHSHGRMVDPAEVAAITPEPSTGPEPYWLRGLRERLLSPPSSIYQRPLTDEPVKALSPEGDVDIYDFVWTGDLPGCLRRLEGMVDVANRLAHTPARTWSHIARMCRFLTGDDVTAMGYLERARFSDVHDDWIEIFGPLGVDRVQREKDGVLAAIELAFDGVPFPGPKHRSLYQAEAADSWRGCDQSKDHQGRWQDLPRDQILDCQFALPHLRAHSLQYYFPALMSFAVREHDQTRDDHKSRNIFDSIKFHIERNPGEERQRAHVKDRHRLFTPAQLAAVARFAEYYGCDEEDVSRWHGLARGDAWP